VTRVTSAVAGRVRPAQRMALVACGGLAVGRLFVSDTRRDMD
jgi:hypothetical protein